MNKSILNDVAYLAASVASLSASLFLWFNGSKESGIYVGRWVPSSLGFLILHRLINK